MTDADGGSAMTASTVGGAGEDGGRRQVDVSHGQTTSDVPPLTSREMQKLTRLHVDGVSGTTLGSSAKLARSKRQNVVLV